MSAKKSETIQPWRKEVKRERMKDNDWRIMISEIDMSSHDFDDFGHLGGRDIESWFNHTLKVGMTF